VKDRRIVVVRDDPQWYVAVGLEAERGVRRVIERAADRSVRLGDDDRIRERVGRDVEDDASDVRVALGIERRARVAAGVRDQE